jgi:dihydrofolate reductase
MIFSMIVAAAENDVIGRDGALPWRIRADSRRFRALTTGHVVLLGRLTHDSIVAALGRPLPGRTSVVITRTGAPLPPTADPADASAPSPGNANPSATIPPNGGTTTSPPNGGTTTSPTNGGTTTSPTNGGTTTSPTNGGTTTSPTNPGRVLWAGSVLAGLDLAERAAASAGDAEVFIAGGVSIYRDTLPATGRIYLTRVHQVVPGDRAMPPGWLTGFDLIRREDGRDEESQLSYSFLDYERAQR